ncbi:MAG: type II toxin-antitoxin system Phd/YefM family antitoxin [Acidobacteriota bacterium]|nr:type II toxin-antitoxin system Phd/YefM family antitoxin [Acidobacteriota bacterium]
MAAGSFKRQCLAVMDEVQARRETVVITKHGRPVAKLVPADKDTDEIYNFLRGKGAIVGDIISILSKLAEAPRGEHGSPRARSRMRRQTNDSFSLAPLGESDFRTPLGSIGPQKSGRGDRKAEGAPRSACRGGEGVFTKMESGRQRGKGKGKRQK